ncbi:hypothetical protein SAMN04489730_3821 [Amycolatopsis australiensis]|uniref:Uncharacterized protein n=1 Tax=Amycolatopsis australiensis TaxID=546364 RepID=A0A1K1RRM9_9PSEU|nr:hypothetical protein SAMN04489730_3821 [Amycolatopsis australiensis]
MVQSGSPGSATAAPAVLASLEPLQLYALLHVYLVTHRPSRLHPGRCAMCRVPWPCPKVRLAARLRDGF